MLCIFRGIQFQSYELKLKRSRNHRKARNSMEIFEKMLFSYPGRDSFTDVLEQLKYTIEHLHYKRIA